jgi:hypothetical protein
LSDGNLLIKAKKLIFLGVLLLLFESKCIVHEKIPERDNDNGDKFREVKIITELIDKQINDDGVDCQPNQANSNEQKIFNRYRSCLLKGPQAVEKEIRAGCEQKAGGIGQIFV